jgi:hypothetical protein
MSNINVQAENVAKRVDAVAVGFDPSTIITILNFVLPLLSNCGVKNSSSKPEDVRDYVVSEHEKNPAKLRKRVARRVRGEAEQEMTKEQSLTLADAVIAEVMNPTSDDNQLSEFIVESQTLDPTV